MVSGPAVEKSGTTGLEREHTSIAAAERFEHGIAMGSGMGEPGLGSDKVCINEESVGEGGVGRDEEPKSLGERRLTWTFFLIQSGASYWVW